MKKSILNIGKALTKTEQKEVHGGLGIYEDCTIPSGNSCDANSPSLFGHPDCNGGEICVGSNPIYGGANNQYFLGWGSGSCQCPE